MAKQAGAPVQTVILHASSPYIGKGWPRLAPAALPARLPRPLGQRFTVEGPAERFSQQLEAYFRSESRPAVRHAVLMPSFDTGPVLLRTVQEACAAWPDVFVVLDGCTDRSAAALAPRCRPRRGCA